MQKLKRAITLLFALVLVVLVMVFTIENRQAVELTMFGKTAPSVPVALYVVIAFIVGLVIGPVLGWWRLQRLQRQCRKQRKQIEALQGEQAKVQPVAPVVTTGVVLAD